MLPLHPASHSDAPPACEPSLAREEDFLRSGCLPVAGELPKPTTHEKDVTLINDLFEVQSKEVGLPPHRVQSSQYHFFSNKNPPEHAAKARNHDGVSGTYCQNGAMYVYLDDDPPPNSSDAHHLRLRTMLHEGLHDAGGRRLVYNNQKQTWWRAISGMRHVPYEDGWPLFYSLDEAIVESMARELMQCPAHKNRIPHSKTPQQPEWYEKDIEILRKILTRIADATNRSTDDIWKTWKRNYFQGGLMHLRDIERTLGPGVLRVYGSVRANDLRMLSKFGKYLKTPAALRRAHDVFDAHPSSTFRESQRRKYKTRIAEVVR